MVIKGHITIVGIRIMTSVPGALLNQAKAAIFSSLGTVQWRTVNCQKEHFLSEIQLQLDKKKDHVLLWILSMAQN